MLREPCKGQSVGDSETSHLGGPRRYVPLRLSQIIALAEQDVIHHTLCLAEFIEAVTYGDMKLLHNRCKCLLDFHEAGLHARFQVAFMSQQSRQPCNFGSA
jgi:hypothetical protein